MSELIRILLVEDDPDDAEFIREVLEHCESSHELVRLIDGSLAIDFLLRQGRFADVWTPDVVLLDLNLPNRDGREVMESVKKDARAAAVPVVVLTNFQSDLEDLREAGYTPFGELSKPPELAQVNSLLSSLRR